MTTHRWNPLTLRCECGTPIATQADHDQHTATTDIPTRPQETP